MKSSRSKIAGALIAPAIIGLAVWFGATPSQAQPTGDGVISGTVRSVDGPEAGVWVVAETDDFQTKMVKIVVTDDNGRFVMPDLPDAEYEVFVRGYGLIDSPRIKRHPGTDNLELTAVVAPSEQEAAEYYPGNYWWSLLEPPTEDMFPGTGPNGNGVNPRLENQMQWFNVLKSNCNFCHQIGNELTRDLDHVFAAKPDLETEEEAWEWRLGTGVRGNSMYGSLGQLGADHMLKALADWTRRIEAGQVPPAPPRPSGIERNVVVTMWDVGDDHSFMHDMISTDKNHPNVNAKGRIYAVNAGHGSLVVLDPNENNTFSLTIPTRQAREEIGSRFPAPNRTSLWFGDEHLWDSSYNPADPHNPMIDSKGRVWMTTKIRDGVDPEYCSDGSKNKYAEYFPLTRSGRQAGYYDPVSGDFTLVDTCFSTHHLQIDNDPDETVYFNELVGPIVGWVDSKVLDETNNELEAVGWCGQVVDTNNDGKITRPWNRVRPGFSAEQLLYQGDTAGGGGGGRGPAYTDFDPAKDSLVSYSLYSVIPSPVDDSVWGVSENFPGMLVRMMRGNNPPESCHTQIFKVPAPGFDPRGVDIASNGVVWTALAGSSHLASFDVTKCKTQQLNAVDGAQCEEGWTLYRTDGPTFPGTDVPADFHYYGWVDQHNVMGFGANTPMATGSNSDSIKILNPQTEQWTTLRVPYPLGYYSRGMDARIDDPNAGWKGRALFSNYGTHFVWHIEGGKGTKGKIVKFQIRPDPLAR